MRLRRMVETKPSGKCHVDESVRLDYAHHEKREWLEIALLDAIKKWGTDRKQFKKIRTEFLTRVVVVRERMSLREQEVHGTWMTEAKLLKTYTPTLGCDAF
ncbi:unnamed protein product [Durusdinium trenchii]|uniref:Uncharacterized protein n=2 Tax=Durusdinium trenchii TaxID=1381693 RepID=A0ABP0MSI4_9DINO